MPTGQRNKTHIYMQRMLAVHSLQHNDIIKNYNLSGALSFIPLRQSYQVNAAKAMLIPSTNATLAAFI